MGRPTNRDARRQELLTAFARTLAKHGYAGATIAAVAAEAGVAPGLVHHHFANKAELLSCLVRDLSARFRTRVSHRDAGGDPLTAYVDAALELDAQADITAAKCWVSIFAEALREPALFEQMRRMIDTELVTIEARADGELAAQQAGAVLAYVIGSLVLGAFAPRKVAGFAANGGHALLRALREPG